MILINAPAISSLLAITAAVALINRLSETDNDLAQHVPCGAAVKPSVIQLVKPDGDRKTDGYSQDAAH